MSSPLFKIITAVAIVVLSGTDSLVASNSFAAADSLEAKNSSVAANSPHAAPATGTSLNVLLLGVDENPTGERYKGTRSDTTMLLSLHPESKRIALVSIPRDSRVAIKGYGRQKINAAHAIGGAKLAVSTVQNDFGVPVNHFIVVDTRALKKLCEILGPMQVDVEKPLKYVDHTAHLSVNIAQGKQLLSPAQVEQYLRFRHDKQADLGRIRRQQSFLKMAIGKVFEPATFLKLPQLISVACNYVHTDISPGEMVNLALTYQGATAENVEYATLPGKPQQIKNVSYWILDLTKSRFLLKNVCGVS